MNFEIDRIEDARKAAAMALDSGAQLAARMGGGKTAGALRGQMCMNALGGSLAKPSQFWAGACVVEGAGGGANAGESIIAIEQAHKLAAAKLAAGDFEFVRESLIGQAQWASVLAVKIGARADSEDRPERLAMLLKLALQAQRQAAQALATAAALNKLNDCTGVGMVD